MNYLAIFIGGGIGSLLRYASSTIFKKYDFFNLPLGTLFANVIASFVLGIILGFFISKKIENEALKNLLIIGVCGGFSTFSTFALENYTFLQQNQWGLSLAYITFSIVASIALIYVGILLSTKIF